ncbi:MAG: hypothetical protein MUF54_17095 [Polyangiaceae bacterium]|nr:hypothetical protein [Polyangiaceae bacterium]
MLDAVKANVLPNVGMAMVPAVVRALGGDMGFVHQALLDASKAGLFELRPESGMGRLSAQERELCPVGYDGAVLSWVRLVDALAPAELRASARKRAARKGGVTRLGLRCVLKTKNRVPHAPRPNARLTSAQIAGVRGIGQHARRQLARAHAAGGASAGASVIFVPPGTARS